MCEHAGLPREWLCAAIATESHLFALSINAFLYFLNQLPFHCVGRTIPFACSESRVNTSDALKNISCES
jgi:hypothetical protein